MNLCTLNVAHRQTGVKRLQHCVITCQGCKDLLVAAHKQLRLPLQHSFLVWGHYLNLLTTQRTTCTTRQEFSGVKISLFDATFSWATDPNMMDGTHVYMLEFSWLFLLLGSDSDIWSTALHKQHPLSCSHEYGMESMQCHWWRGPCSWRLLVQCPTIYAQRVQKCCPICQVVCRPRAFRQTWVISERTDDLQ